MTRLRLADLYPGLRLTSRSVTMTEADMLAFAREFDPQPMHTDPAWAATGPLGGLIASGWHTATVALRLQRELGLPATGLHEIASLAWPLPVRPGDEIHAEIEIKATEPSGLVHFQNTVLNGGGQVVQSMAGAVLAP